jgi:tetratricopeptide (TPR) repeat protein
MTAPSEIIAQAEELRKQQKFDDAANLYQQAWQTNQNPFAGHWLIYCLRKTGQLDQANQIAREALKQCPDDIYIRTELGWVIYDRELKPAREKSDIGRALHFAREAIEISNNELLILKVAQIVVKTAKNLNQSRWDVIVEWAPKIKPDQLDAKKRSTSEGKEYMSEREEWFVSYSRALLETGKFQLARQVAQEGIQEFPNEIFLLRTAAWAQFRSGNQQKGAEEMRSLLNHPRCDWYVKAELADMESQLGNPEEAYRLVCQALQNRQEDKYKLGSFETIARLALQMGKLEVAAAHITLAKSIRTQQGWKIPVDLTQLEQQLRLAFKEKLQEYPTFPEDPRELSRRCSLFWREGSAAGLERFIGIVMRVVSERKFTFIQPSSGGENVFVFLRELPRDCAHEGARVEYSLEKSFDQKKNRESYRAIQVRKA